MKIQDNVHYTYTTRKLTDPPIDKENKIKKLGVELYICRETSLDVAHQFGQQYTFFSGRRGLVDGNSGLELNPNSI